MKEKFKKPPHIRELKNPHNVEIIDEPPGFVKRSLARGTKRSNAISRGLDYEERVHRAFKTKYGKYYVSNAWIAYRETKTGKKRYASPDAVLFFPEEKRIKLIEIKLTHTIRAWWQLRKMYEPLIRKIFPGWKVEVVEVCSKYFKTTWPEKIDWIYSIEDPVSNFGVLKLEGKHLRRKEWREKHGQCC